MVDDTPQVLGEMSEAFEFVKDEATPLMARVFGVGGGGGGGSQESASDESDDDL
jgi:hypothetical protein